jgi:RHS repeat-associated protein
VISALSVALPAQNYLTMTGISGSTVPYPAEMGTVDAANGNLHLEIPLGSFPQRGGSGSLVPKLVYDSHIWTVLSDGSSYVWTPEALYSSALAFGTWGFDEGGAGGVFLLAWAGNGGHFCDGDYMLYGQSGGQHYFNIPGTWNGTECSGGTAYATDSSGFLINQTPWNNNGLNATISVYAPDGTEVWGTDLYTSGVASKDSNGNYLGLTYSNNSPPGIDNPIIDTLGRTIVTPAIDGSTTTLSVMNSQAGTSNYVASNYVVTTAAIPVSTDFQQSNVTECNDNCTVTVITNIALPDGSSYSFQYDCYESGNAACGSPSGQSGYYGTLTSMTLPTGGTVNYAYTNFTDSLGGVGRWLFSKSTSTGFWQYSPVAMGNTNQQVTVYKPGLATDVISLTVDGSGTVWPTQILSYDSGYGALLSTVNNTWDFSVPCTTILCSIAFLEGIGNGDDVPAHQDIRKLSTSTTLPMPGGSITKQTKYSYDSPQTGNVTGVQEWKYQNGPSPTFPSIPDRATYTTYATIGTNNNINHPKSITVCNNVGTNSSCTGGGTPVAQTNITYDAYGNNGLLGLQDRSTVVNHDDANFGPSYTARGNPTQISQWVSGSNYLNSYFSYDVTGQVLQSEDPNSNITTYSYADVFYSDNGANPPQAFTPATPTNAYVTSITDAIGVTSAGYYYGSGHTALVTDYNNRTTYSHYVNSTTLVIDPFDRPTEAVYPIGWSLNTYTSLTQADSYAAVGDTAASTSCTSCIHTQALLDNFGRTTTQYLVNNPAGEVQVTATYDGFNRVVSASHPNFGSSDPNDVSETQAYDGLGRTINVTHPDGQLSRVAFGANVANVGGVPTQQSSPATYGYGYPVASLDEAGMQKQEWLDGFGHVIEVDEPSVATSTPGGGSVTINLTGDLSNTYNPCAPHGNCPITIYNKGEVIVTVNDFSGSADYAGAPIDGSTTQSVATSLASAFNVPNSPVTAVANGSSVTLTAITGGVITNFSFSTSATYDNSDKCGSNYCFTGPAFTASPATGALSGGTGGLDSSPAVTTYTYDALGNLTSVTQGLQARSWQYDGLSRLTQEVTPEHGTVTLSYLTSSGFLCSGNPSNPCTRTAPATNQTTGTVTTTYGPYDTANRLTKKTHSDTTGTETYTYGTSAANNNVGRLTKMTDPSGSESYSYDTIGRVTQVTKVVGTTSYITKYSYNTGSELTKITYPSGRVVEYSYDHVGHLCEVAVSAGANCGSNTGLYLTLPSLSYDAASRPLSATYGNGVVATAAYSPQTAELTSLSYAKGSATLFGLNYYYQQNSTYCPTGNAVGNNGQIQCIADVSSGTGDSGRSAVYTYDQLGRLLTANTTGSTQYPAWGLSWTYDRYGNRTAQTVTAGSGYTSLLTINPVNNQVTSPAYTYDAAGNVTAEPAPGAATYTYDAEECNTSYTGNGTAAYTCDGNGLRVEKAIAGEGTTTVYVRSGGQVIAEYDNSAAPSAPTREYLYGNNLLAIVTGGTGAITYQHRDTLSPRIYTDVNGNCVGDQGTFPYGELWYQNTDTECGTSATSSWIFTSYERDAESGNDYALARSYTNSNGRFLSPDPLQGHVGDPQSWNRYAYVENDPINLSDPSGQGFWADLGFAIADIFATILLGPGIDPALTAAEAGAESATVTVLTPWAWVWTGAYFAAVWERVAACAAGVCLAAGSSAGPPSKASPENTGSTEASPGTTAPQATGGPGAGTTDPGQTGASGQGPTSGRAPSVSVATVLYSNEALNRGYAGARIILSATVRGGHSVAYNWQQTVVTDRLGANAPPGSKPNVPFNDAAPDTGMYWSTANQKQAMDDAAKQGATTIFKDAPQRIVGAPYHFKAKLSLIGIDPNGAHTVLWTGSWGFKVDAMGRTTLAPLKVLKP